MFEKFNPYYVIVSLLRIVQQEEGNYNIFQFNNTEVLPQYINFRSIEKIFIQYFQLSWAVSKWTEDSGKVIIATTPGNHVNQYQEKHKSTSGTRIWSAMLCQE